jgi:hypothetical protein
MPRLRRGWNWENGGARTFLRNENTAAKVELENFFSSKRARQVLKPGILSPL